MPFGSLGLGLGLGGLRVGDAGNMPATFSIAAGSVDDGIKRINFSETITVTITGDVTADFGDGQGELTAGTHTVSNALDYWTLKITGGTGGGTITFGKRKQITYLYLAYLNSLVVKGDITGMKLTSLLLYSLGLSTITGDISGMELTYLQGERDPGELPATFSIAAGSVDDGIKRINFSEPVIVTITGDVTLSIGSTEYKSGDTIPVATGEYHTLTINNPGADAGTITFGKRKQVTYLYLRNLGSSVITGDITGMKLTYLLLSTLGSSVITGDITGMRLTYLYLNNIGSSVITGDITGMELTYLDLLNLGSSVITGDITGMKLTYLYLAYISQSVITGDISGMELTYLYLRNLGSSVITGDITGMELTSLYLNLGSSVITGDITGMKLTYLYLNGIGSSLTYGTNPLNITNDYGIRLLGNTVFATDAEYEQLIHDAAIAAWGGAYPFTITAGTNDNCPDWDTVKEDVATLLTKAAWTIIPSAWLSANGGSWPADWNEYTGE